MPSTLINPRRAKSIVNYILMGVLSMGWLFGCAFWSQAQPDEETLTLMRQAMVRTQIEARDIENERVLQVMREVKRHLFVPETMRSVAYVDRPLPIGEDQTISQPYIVAIMTELLDPQEDDIALEIGTGSGYQAAVLAELVDQVYTIEIIESLGKRAEKLLNEELEYENIHVKIGDGYQGWPEVAPFDKIIVTAAPPRVPQPLIDQLKVGGRMVIPVGRNFQELLLITKDEEGVKEERVIPVRFVPMTGQAQEG